MSTPAAVLILALVGLADPPPGSTTTCVRIPVSESREIDLVDLVARLAEATGVAVPRPAGELRLPIDGPPGALTRTMLAESLGEDATLAFGPDSVTVALDPSVRGPARLGAWKGRLETLAAHAGREIKRRSGYGMHALKSYRPNDPARPTVLLVHGLNSTSGVFRHLIGALEAEGFGLVVYDFPYNRRLDESCDRFRHDWKSFRARVGETRPWAVLCHSMGSLLARSYVEDDAAYGGDVSTLILVAPPNVGSSLSKAQAAWQLVKGSQALRGGRPVDAFAHLGDGLGESAADMAPGSEFLQRLNARPRREGVAYHILAGDAGFLGASARRQIEARMALVGGLKGVLGGVARVASADLSEGLDELTGGTGDGLVTVESTRLAGVADHVTIHADHLELIRAPLLYPEPGPIAGLPYILRWLSPRPAKAAPGGPREGGGDG